MNLKEELKSKVLLPIKEAGFEAYFVGGCVRDMLMGVEPHDFDITTNATPENLHKIFSSFSNVSNNSEPFGVTMPLIKFSDETVEEIEIATFRKDITKGRHPKIEFTTSIQEDAERRDFTVNAIYEDADGHIIDPVKGADDIKANTLRFIGNAQDRISEDPLRVFRFVRFLASKGFKSAHGIPECMTWKADFDDVSKERILKELEKTFGGKFLFSGEITPFMFFMACGIHHKIGMTQLMVDMSNIEQSWMWHSEGSTWIVDGKETPGDEVSDFTKAEPVKHGNVWDHVIRVMELMSEKTQDDLNEHHRFIMMMSAFLHDIGKAVDHEMEGSHIQLGVELCKKYKESAVVINAVESHHGDVEPQSLIACIVQAADTISAARPGARRETLETYTNRLKQLEEIANQYKGVDKSFAIQAGREIRIMVVPEQVSDADMVLMARNISKQIEFELEYPGQVKVNVIRESRVTDYAK